MEALLKPLAYGWHGPLYVDQGFLSHLGWGFAVPLLGYWLGGPRWLKIIGAVWVLHALYRELIEEALDATTLSDIASRCAPVFILLAIEVLRSHRAALRAAAARV
jgi:hypothetical protein